MSEAADYRTLAQLGPEGLEESSPLLALTSAARVVAV